MTRTGIMRAAACAATVAVATVTFAPAASAQAPYPYRPGYARVAPPAYGYSWRPGYGWYVSYRTRLPGARAGFVPVGGPVPYGAYGPVGWATPYQDSTIYATDARRIYAYPTYVVPTATAVTYGTGCLPGSGCAWTLGWR